MNRLSKYINTVSVVVGSPTHLAASLEAFLNNVYYGVDPRITDRNGNLIPLEDMVVETLRETIVIQAKSFHGEMVELMRMIKYRPEPEFYPEGLKADFPQTADITLLGGTGDCEDIARVVCVYGAHAGYKTYILLMLENTGYAYMGHAVGVAKVNNKYCAYELDKVIEADSIEGIARYYGTLGFEIFYLYDFSIDQPVTKRVKYADEVAYKDEKYVVKSLSEGLLDITNEGQEKALVFILYALILLLLIVRVIGS